MGGNSYYMAVGISGIQTCRCHDAIHRHLADNLGEKTGEKIDWPVLKLIDAVMLSFN